jgi:hypothetical protein
MFNQPNLRETCVLAALLLAACANDESPDIGANDLGGTDASKVCLVHLVRHLQRLGFVLFDAQLSNPHLLQFGLYELRAEQYIEQLEACQRGDAPKWEKLLAQ